MIFQLLNRTLPIKFTVSRFKRDSKFKKFEEGSTEVLSKDIYEFDRRIGIHFFHPFTGECIDFDISLQYNVYDFIEKVSYSAEFRIH